MAKYITVVIGGPRSKTVLVAYEQPGSRGTKYTEIARCLNETRARNIAALLNTADTETPPNQP